MSQVQPKDASLIARVERHERISDRLQEQLCAVHPELTGTRAQLIAALAILVAATPQELARRTGTPAPTARKAARWMLAAGLADWETGPRTQGRPRYGDRGGLLRLTQRGQQVDRLLRATER